MYRGMWRGTFVAAKVISIPGVKEKLWENEISIYRCMEGNNVPHSHNFRTLNHPNLLALLGVIFSCHFDH